MDAPSLRRLFRRIEAFSPDLFAREPTATLLFRLLKEELASPGPRHEALANALAESVVVYLTRAATGATRRLEAPRALGDRRIQKAIALMEAALAARWTVEVLAKAVGLSRAAFARQFLLGTGSSPRRHLARRRMQRAAELLCESDAGLAEIAKEVGYDSEFAFSRAFKRYHRLPPGVFRRAAPIAPKATPRMAA